MEHPLKQRPEIYKDYKDLVKSFIVYSITKSESDKEKNRNHNTIDKDFKGWYGEFIRINQKKQNIQQL